MGASGQGHLEDQSDSWVHEYLSLLASRRSIVAGDGDPLTARLIERVNRGHASGWFLSDLALRLGLIGTVIGFVLMLGSVYELEPGDVSALRELMATMGSGMRVALYTTLSALGLMNNRLTRNRKLNPINVLNNKSTNGSAVECIRFR